MAVATGAILAHSSSISHHFDASSTVTASVAMPGSKSACASEKRSLPGTWLCFQQAHNLRLTGRTCYPLPDVTGNCLPNFLSEPSERSDEMNARPQRAAGVRTTRP